MFQIGDIVVYENGGVCKVVKIGTPDFMKGDTQFYFLQPLFDNSGMIYLKVENDTHILKPLPQPQEVDEILGGAKDIAPMYNSSEKQRGVEFKEALRSCEIGQWIAMLKGILMEKDRREKRGKRLNMSDDRNMQKVEQLLTTEISVVYQIPVEKAEERVQGVIAQ